MEGLLGTGRDVLVARDGALADLDTVVARSTGALLTGEAGIGKSHLGQAFGERLRARGLPVVQVTALTALSSTPLAALRPLVGAGPAAHRDPVDWATERLVEDNPAGLLLIDDVDALDDLSAAALHRLAQTPRRRRPPRLLLTMRNGRTLPAPMERLLTDGTLEHLRVGPLPEGGVRAFAEHLLSGPVHPLAARELCERSGGNPLLARETVLAAWEQHAWVRSEDGWRLNAAVHAPERLQPLVDARVDALPAPARQLAELLAIAGPLPLQLLVRMDLVGAVGALEGAGIGRVRGEEATLAHPLFEEALQLRIDGSRRTTWTLRLLDAAAQVNLPPGPSVRLATLALSQDHALDGARLAMAAQMALSLFDLATARDLADAAAAAGGPADAALIAAQARAMLGDDAGRSALEALSDSPDPQLRAQALLTRARLAMAGEDGPSQVLELLGSVPPTARTDTMRAVALMRLNEWQQATEAADAALARTSDPVVWVDAAGIATLLHTWGGDPARAVTLAERGLAMIDDGALCGPHGSIVLAQPGCVAALLQGDAAAADRIAGYTEPVSGAPVNFEAHRALRRGVLAVYRGHHDAAGVLTSAARLLSEGDPVVDLRLWAWAFLARASLRVGDVPGAEAAVLRGREVAFHGQVAPQVELRVAEGWLAAARGEPAQGCRMLAQLCESQSSAVPGSAGLIAVDLARLGDLDGATGCLVEIEPRAGSPVLSTARQLLEAVVRVDVPAMCGRALELQAAGLHLWAADLLAVGSHRVAGPDQDLLAARAHAAAAACGGPGTPALAAVPPRLTRTQLRVAGLAAQGLTNRQVGESLEISPRTAATHLHRAYQALGVHDRAELSRLFPR